jgi:hypothetical protein
VSKISPKRSYADVVPEERATSSLHIAALQSLVGVMARREIMAQLALTVARGVLAQAERSVVNIRRVVTTRQQQVNDFRHQIYTERLSDPLGISNVRMLFEDESRLVDSAWQASNSLEERKAEAAEADAELKRKLRLLRLLAIRREKYQSAVEELEAE